MIKTLVLEDCLEMQSLIRLALQDMCNIQTVDSLTAAQAALNSDPYGLVLVDLEVKDGLSFSLLSQIQTFRRDTVTVVLSGRKNVEEKLMCFKLGADDYLVKPIDHRELRARIEVKLKGKAGEETGIQIHNILIKRKAQQVYQVSASGLQQVHLTPIEFKILAHFVDARDQVFSRQTLMDKVWGSGSHITDRAVDSHICTLRKKIGSSGAFLRTVYGQGYIFVSK